MYSSGPQLKLIVSAPELLPSAKSGYTLTACWQHQNLFTGPIQRIILIFHSNVELFEYGCYITFHKSYNVIGFKLISNSIINKLRLFFTFYNRVMINFNSTRKLIISIFSHVKNDSYRFTSGHKIFQTIFLIVFFSCPCFHIYHII